VHLLLYGGIIPAKIKMAQDSAFVNPLADKSSGNLDAAFGVGILTR
jgi:hypothetical protein